MSDQHMTKQEIRELVGQNKQMMDILRAVKTLDLPDWWIGAGFVRNTVWNYLHSFKSELVNDIDVIFYDKSDTTWDTEKLIEEKLESLIPGLPWSVKNQARMHIKNGDPEYTDSVDALSHWLETATCVAVKLDKKDNVILAAPHGIDDLVQLKVVLTPRSAHRKEIYEQRMKDKNWSKRWPKLTIFHTN